MCDLIEERMVFGPGSLKGQPAVLDDDKRAIIYAAYEVFPQGHEFAGRRRFKRVGVSVRKGLAKTELMAWVTQGELHPEGPVRCDGFDAYGQPVGRPVVDPYIPLLAVTVEQVEELAFGALYMMVTEGPDADLFDATQERIVRLDERGRADGKAVPLANSPGARDGARTTFQGFDEPHRLHLPRQVAAHETMVANLEKRVLEDPWGLYVGTAGEPGQGSVAEGVHAEAKAIDKGEIDEPQLFYFHREAGPGYDMNDLDQRIAAVAEATGPVGEYGPGQFRSIAKQWDRPKADKKYLERVWLNRWTRSDEQAFDPKKRLTLLVDEDPFKRNAFVTAGFDGARFRDSTGIVITHVESGRQKLWSLWEREDYNLDPETGELEPWEIDEAEVTESVTKLMTDLEVWRFNADPPHWTETVGSWAGTWDCVEEWWTNRIKAMAYAVRNYGEAMDTGAVTFVAGDPLEEKFAEHMGNAGRKDVNLWDDAEDSDEHQRGRQLFILRKLHTDRKFDAQMAAILSWEARLEAIKQGAKPRRRRGTVKRLR
ncbi:hypothetical protein [Mumia sp. DW29H23]|uniref:hypothetical protein n=1 Tax=Mumia sp. DW29H23 TaxID=3421241 RepID=UPI003D699F6A